MMQHLYCLSWRDARAYVYPVFNTTGHVASLLLVPICKYVNIDDYSLENEGLSILHVRACPFAFRQVAFGEVRGKNDALANSFHISSYPSLVFFCGGDAGVSFPYEVRLEDKALSYQSNDGEAVTNLFGGPSFYPQNRMWTAFVVERTRRQHDISHRTSTGRAPLVLSVRCENVPCPIRCS